MSKKITADLDRLIKKASEIKTAGVKQSASISSKLDGAPDGTSKMTTGEQAAKNKEESGAVVPASVDGGGKGNVTGKSVENSTDNATAASTSGDAGGSGAELSVKKDADNGAEKPQNKIAELRDQAAALHKAAAALLTPFDHFMVKAARASEDKQVKTAAEAMADDDLADAASDQLMEQLATGQVDDTAAAQILEEALQAGALTPEEVQQAAELAKGAAGGAGEAAPAAAPAAADTAAAPVAPEAPPAPAEGDADMQAKLAAAEIGPEHPEYIAKLDAMYNADQDAGARYFAKVAGVLLKQAEEDEKKDSKKEEKKEEKTETPAQEKAEKPAEQAQEAAAGTEAPVAAPAAPAAPAVPAAPIDAMSGVNLAPTDPAEQQALEAIKAELGLNDQQLAELAATKAPAMPMDKVASAKAAYRAAIMSKVASLKN